MVRSLTQERRATLTPCGFAAMTVKAQASFLKNTKCNSVMFLYKFKVCKLSDSLSERSSFGIVRASS